MAALPLPSMDLDMAEKESTQPCNPPTTGQLEPAWQPMMLPDPPSASSSRMGKHNRLPSISTLLEQLPPLSASSPLETTHHPISLQSQTKHNSNAITPSIPPPSIGSSSREAIVTPSPIAPLGTGFTPSRLGSHAAERHRGGMHKKSYSMGSFDLHQIQQHQEQLRQEQNQQRSHHQLYSPYSDQPQRSLHVHPQPPPFQQQQSTLQTYTVHYPPVQTPQNQPVHPQNGASTDSDHSHVPANHLLSNNAFHGFHKKTSSLDSNGSGSSDFGQLPTTRSQPPRAHHHARSLSHGGAGIAQTTQYLSSPHHSVNTSPLLQGQQPSQPSAAQLANYRLQTSNEIRSLPPQSQPFARQPQQTPAPFVVDFRVPQQQHVQQQQYQQHQHNQQHQNNQQQYQRHQQHDQQRQEHQQQAVQQQQQHQQQQHRQQQAMHQQQQPFHTPQAIFHPPLPGTGRPRHVHHVRQASAPTIPSTVFINSPAPHSQPPPFQTHYSAVQRHTPQLDQAAHHQIMRKQQQHQQQPIPVTNNQPTTTTQSDNPIRSYSPSSSNENSGGGGGGGGGSYEEDADDNEAVQLNANGNPIKRRLRANREQLRVLESVFEQNRTPSPGFKKDLAKKLGMPHKSILYWFQNRRAQLVRSQKQQMKVNQGSETDPQSAAHYQEDGEYEEFDEEDRHEESGGPSSFIGNPRNI